MEDLDDDEYGYTTESAIFSKIEKEDINLEDTFMDAQEFCPYKKESQSPMISRGFFSPPGIVSLFVFVIFLYIHNQ